MSHSSLCSRVVPAHPSNYTHSRNGRKICKFTPHHMAGILTAERCAQLFQNPNRNASATYCIGNDGTIVCSVEEEFRPWTSSSPSNDYQAITVEVSNSAIGGDWPISDAAWNSLVNLAVDVCKRNGFRLDYNGTPSGSLTRHNMFANTSCPGPYLQSRLPELAETVNRILDEGDKPKPEPAKGDKQVQAIQRWCNANYGTNIAEDGIFGPATHKAIVKSYQTALNRSYNAKLVVDGIFGPATKRKTPIVKQGARGNVVRCIQSMLYCKGFNTNGVDGIFGQGTKTAVTSFQKKNNLGADGIFGPNTAEKLYK